MQEIETIKTIKYYHSRRRSLDRDRDRERVLELLRRYLSLRLQQFVSEILNSIFKETTVIVI